MLKDALELCDGNNRPQKPRTFDRAKIIVSTNCCKCYACIAIPSAREETFATESCI